MMRQTLIALFLFILPYVVLATDYNNVQTSINLIREYSKGLQDVYKPSEINSQTAGDVTYFLDTILIPIKNSKAQIQAFTGTLQSSEADTIVSSITLIESDFAKGMPSIIDLKAALIAAGAKDEMEYYINYLNEAIHGFAKPLPKILPSPQQATAKSICAKLQEDTQKGCQAYYDKCSQYVF